MLAITEQLSKINTYCSTVGPLLCDSKIASVAVTALSLVASAFSFFTLPHMITYTLAAISVIAVGATTALFVKLHQQASVEAKAAAEKAMEAAKKADEKAQAVTQQVSFLSRILGSYSGTAPQTAEDKKAVASV